MQEVVEQEVHQQVEHLEAQLRQGVLEVNG
jgi:hypothetical protein